MSEQAKAIKISRPDNSQRFPFINLPRALDRVREMYKVAANHEVPVVTAGKSWGYSEKSSGIAMTVSALKYFGLIEDSGANEARKIKLSETALKIIRDPRDISPDRDALIRQAALLPPIHREIVTKYGGLPPSDDAFKAYLLLDRGFKDDAAIDFMKEFTATMAFAKMSDSGTVQETGDELPPLPELDQSNMQQQTPNPPANPPAVSPTTAPSPVLLGLPEAGSRRAVFALTEGDVTITFPEDLSPESVADLADYLEIFMKKAKREAGVN